MATARITAPSSARRNEVIEIRATIAHPMETGFRPGADGKTVPRNIIRSFTCHYNDTLVFSAELFPAVSAYPYIAFFTVATESGQLRLHWQGDNGFTHTQTVAIEVT